MRPFALALIAALGPSLATLAPAAAQAQVSEEQRIVESIPDEIRADFGIRVAMWKPAVLGGLSAHAFIVGSTAPDAVYSPAGDLVQVGATAPVSYAIRVPANRLADRLILFIPPGNLEHTFAAGLFPALMAEGYPVVVANHIRWFDARLDALGHPHPSREELTEAYIEGFHLAKQLYGKLFGEPTRTYALASSRGVQLGLGPIRNLKRLCDGQVLNGGTAGVASRIPGVIESVQTGLVPKTGVVTPSSGPFTPAVLLREYIGDVDPEYFALMESGAASALDYDLSTRPESVTDWDFSGDLQVPTIIIQGLGDWIAYPYEQVTFVKRINAARATDRYRLYLVPKLIHVPQPIPPQRAAFHMLEAWVEHGTPPGSLDYSAPFPPGQFPGVPTWIQNSHQLRLELDPDAYFNQMLTLQQ